MPTYTHLQEVKKTESLPAAEGEKIGVCLTCHYWEAETPRAEAHVPKLALCVQSQLKPFALIVSGSSGCNKWKEHPEAGPQAKAYAERGEEKLVEIPAHSAHFSGGHGSAAGIGDECPPERSRTVAAPERVSFVFDWDSGDSFAAGNRLARARAVVTGRKPALVGLAGWPAGRSNRGGVPVRPAQSRRGGADRRDRLRAGFHVAGDGQFRLAGNAENSRQSLASWRCRAGLCRAYC